MTKYLDNEGSLVFVSSGLGGGAPYFVMRTYSGKTGLHRVKSPKLPPRDKAEQAQKDLDAYAKMKGWRESI